MIHLKTSVSLLVVLLAVVPVTPKDTPPRPDDPAALPVDPPEEFPEDDESDAPTAGRPGLGAPTTGKKPITEWRECALRCKKKCVDKYNPNNCATKFVSNRCQLFPPKLANTALTKCLGAIDCENSGMKVCENNLECLLEEQCCLEGHCGDEYRCVNHWCAAKGLPSFTVTWAGAGTYP
jgi:hypothetical protein